MSENVTLPTETNNEYAEGLRDNADFLRGRGMYARARQLEQAANEINTLEVRCRELKAAYDRMFEKAVELEREVANG